jgi:hypothetical protein
MKEVIALLVLVVASMYIGWKAGSSFSDFEFAHNERKTFTWSNISELRTELAKGYVVRQTYDVTNNILEKVSK